MALRFFIAAAAAILVSVMLPAPSPERAQGRLFTVLSRARPPVPVAPELVLIQAEPGAMKPLGSLELAEIMLTLEEMEAGRVLDLLPPGNVSAGGALSPERLKSLEAGFDKEFSLIGKNIATLFDAIRLGSVRTRDSARFVDELLALVGEGKTRLYAEVMDKDDEGLAVLGKVRAVMGTGRYADDLEGLGVSLPEFPGAFLIVETPGIVDGAIPFRRIDIREVSRYAALDKALYGILVDMEHAGYLAQTDPGAHPPALYDYTLSLRQDMLARPGQESVRLWRAAREQYLLSVRKLMAGQSESELLAGFDALLAAETLDEAGTARLRDLRLGVVSSFAAARSALDQLQSVKVRLQGELRGAFCIAGEGPEQGRAAEALWLEPTKAESAAALVNAVFTGRHVRVPTDSRTKAWILLPGLALAGLLAPFGFLISSLAGLAAVAVVAGAFSLLFLRSGVWIDPGFAAAVMVASVAASLAVEAASRYRIVSCLRHSAGNRLPQALVKRLSAAHAVPSLENRVAKAAILAIRHFGEGSRNDPDDDERLASSLRAFHEAAAKEILKRGGVVLGSDEFIVTAGFGTPLEQAARGLGSEPCAAARAAYAAALDIVASEPETSADWRFGLDLGDCSFFYSSIDGYRAVGRPVNYARLLSGLASKYNSRILVAQGIASEAGAAGDSWKTRRLDSLVEKASGNEHAFYELIFQPKP